MTAPRRHAEETRTTANAPQPQPSSATYRNSYNRPEASHHGRNSSTFIDNHAMLSSRGYSPPPPLSTPSSSSHSRAADVTFSSSAHRHPSSTRSHSTSRSRTTTTTSTATTAKSNTDHISRVLNELVLSFFARASADRSDSGYASGSKGDAGDAAREEGSTSRVRQAFLYSLRILGSRMTPSVVSDEMHVADLIRKKLYRENKTSEKALQFSNLFSRLQSQTILTRKWAILYLLLQISEQTDSANVEMSSILHGAPADTSSAYMGLQSFSTSKTHHPQTHTSTLPSSENPPPTRAPSSSVPPPETPHSTAPPAVSKSDSNRAPYNSQKRTKAIGETRSPYHQLLDFSTDPAVPELALLRDVVFALQGINGKYITFDDHAQSFIIDAKAKISKPNRTLIHRITETGWLYRRVQKYVKKASRETSATGLVGQAFCSSLSRDLTDYYRLIALLESQILHRDRDSGKSAAEDSVTSKVDASASPPSSGLTLKRVLIWTQEVTQKLRLMSVLVDRCADHKGGALVSLIYTYINHGDPFIQTFITKTLEEVSRPFYQMLRKWVEEGQLEDPYQEFFVAGDSTITASAGAGGDIDAPTAGDDKSNNANNVDLWKTQYKMRQEMVPAFVSPSLARKIFLIGKSLNFIRHSCRNGEWVLKRSRESTAGRKFSYTHVAQLETSIDREYQASSRYLFETLLNQYKLMDHLRALKKYLLLGQGDFVQQLLDLLSPTLSNPATTLFRHKLTGILESAIRGGVVQYEDPDILKRLDVRILEPSTGDIGWDVFSLDYHVDAPISTVLTPSAMHQYLRIFHFLWRLKRSEHELTTGWKRQMTSAHALKDVGEEMTRELHLCSVTLGEMVHFVYQMQYYMVFEVLECSWQQLEDYVEKGRGDLDGLIEAHETYLDTIVAKAMLDSNEKTALTTTTTTTKTGVKSKGFVESVCRVFDIVTEFRRVQDELYDRAVSEVERRTRLERKAYQQTLQGRWGLTDEDEFHEGIGVEEREREEQRLLASLRQASREASKGFKSEVLQILKILSPPPVAEGHERSRKHSASTTTTATTATTTTRTMMMMDDSHVKSLAVRLDYNERYAKMMAAERERERERRERS